MEAVHRQSTDLHTHVDAQLQQVMDLQMRLSADIGLLVERMGRLEAQVVGSVDGVHPVSVLLPWGQATSLEVPPLDGEVYDDFQGGTFVTYADGSFEVQAVQMWVVKLPPSIPRSATAVCFLLHSVEGQSLVVESVDPDGKPIARCVAHADAQLV